MIVILLLFLAGIVLLAADVFVSSFILAVIGGVVMLIGCGVVYNDYGAASAFVTAIFATFFLVGTIYFELVFLPRTKLGRGLVVHSASDSTSQPPLATAEVVGRSAEAITTLAPTGYVLIDGRRYEAFCQSGHITKGETLRVIGLDNFRLIVSKS